MATTSPAAYRAGCQDSPLACPPFPGSVARRGSRLAAAFHVTYQMGGKDETLSHFRLFRNVRERNQRLTRI